MSDPIDTKNHPTVKALEAHRLRLEMSDRAMAGRIRISPSAWSGLKGGTYNVKDPLRMLQLCEAALRVIEEEAAASDDSLLLLTEQRAVINAVKLAASEERDRLVPYLGETGAGKTTLSQLLQAKYGEACVVMEATETWRDSYFSAVLGVARALGVEPQATARATQDAILDGLAVSPRILVIDEAHYCGREAMNLVKLVLNDRRVRTRVVMLAIPQLWAQMCRSNAQEAAQLRNRTLAKVVMAAVRADDCRAFMAAKMNGYTSLNGEETMAVAAVCAAATKFGLLNTVRRICKEVNDVEKTASLDAVTAAIKRVEALRS